MNEWLTIEEAGEQFRRRALSPRELLDSCLARIERFNPALRGFIHVMGDEAREQATRAEHDLGRGRDLGPLHGIPLAIKDIIDIAGLRTTAGSRLLQDAPQAEADAPVVAALRAAGAVIVGKTSTHEFAIGGASLDEPYPTGRNPWDTERITGGSSSGNGVAVAAGMCFGAVGSDTGGSIRGPSANCSLTGLKPTYGTVSLDGVVPLCPSLDTLGPMTHTARDAALMLGVMVPGPDLATRMASSDERLTRPRVALERVFFEPSQFEAPIVAALEAAAGVFKNAGAAMSEVEMQDHGDVRALWSVFLAESYAWHEPTIEQHPELYGQGARDRILEGKDKLAVEYVRGLGARQLLARDLTRIFQGCDAILAPVGPITAPTFEEHALNPVRAQKFSMLANLTGLPAVAFQAGFTDLGVPIGLQLIGPSGSDAFLLELVARYQRLTDWHTRHPEL